MIRHEYGIWPFSRMDKNLQYLAKSFIHQRKPATESDRTHYSNVHRELQRWTSSNVEENEKVLRLSAMGDLMWIRSGWRDFLSPGIANHLASRDLRIANLETPIHPGKPVKKYVYETLQYNAPPEYLVPWDHPSAHTILSICNNHILDQGPDGLALTRKEILSHKNFLCVGGFSEEDAICFVEVKGHRIAYIGLTYDVNRMRRESIPPGIPVHLFGRLGFEPDWDKIQELISLARRGGAELTILLPHWNYEYEYWPDELHRQHAYRLIELGIDIILGSAPHVLQPVEIVSVDQWDPSLKTQLKRGGPPRFGIIGYSLGNFASIMPTLACNVGVILDLDLSFGERGELSLHKIQVYPTYSSRGQNGWLDVQTRELGAQMENA